MAGDPPCHQSKKSLMSFSLGYSERPHLEKKKKDGDTELVNRSSIKALVAKPDNHVRLTRQKERKASLLTTTSPACTHTNLKMKVETKKRKASGNGLSETISIIIPCVISVTSSHRMIKSLKWEVELTRWSGGGELSSVRGVPAPSDIRSFSVLGVSPSALHLGRRGMWFEWALAFHYLVPR